MISQINIYVMTIECCNSWIYIYQTFHINVILLLHIYIYVQSNIYKILSINNN